MELTMPMNLNIKKNNIDELFANLTENPVGMENKDFRLQLSTIYQLFEDEFENVFSQTTHHWEILTFICLKTANFSLPQRIILNFI